MLLKDDLSEDGQNLANMIQAMRDSSKPVMTPKAAAMRLAAFNAMLLGDLSEFARNSNEMWGGTPDGKKLVQRLYGVFQKAVDGDVSKMISVLLDGLDAKDEFHQAMKFVEQTDAAIIEVH